MALLPSTAAFAGIICQNDRLTLRLEPRQPVVLELNDRAMSLSYPFKTVHVMGLYGIMIIKTYADADLSRETAFFYYDRRDGFLTGYYLIGDRKVEITQADDVSCQFNANGT